MFSKPNLARADAPAESEEALLLRIQKGDEQAMASLFKLHSRLVYAVGLRVLKDSAKAEDLLQEVFMQIWKKPQAFDSARGGLSSFLSIVTRNRAIDMLRARRQEQFPDNFDIPSTFNLADDSERRLVLERVREVADNLPAEQRRMLDLAFFEGLTHSEIASQTKTPLGTVKTRIRNALLTLERTLTV